MRKNQDSLSLLLSEELRPVVERMTNEMLNGFFVYHADGDEELIFSNDALVSLYGCEGLEDFKRHTGYVFRGLVHPDDWERVSKSIHSQIVEDGGRLDYVEYRIVRKDGDIRWIRDFGHFFHTERYGDVFYVFLEDATDQRLKELSEARTAQLSMERGKTLAQLEHETTALRMVHEMLRSGMWSMEFDERGQMVSVFWSDEFRGMLGYRSEEDFPNVLESWSDLLHEEDRERVLEAYYGPISDYTGKKTFDTEYRLLTKDRGWRWFRSVGKLSRRADGTPITYVGMFVDVTRQKQTEETLGNQRRQLEEALQQAQRASQSKSEFLSSMSRSIRTPMNAIVGYTALASRYLDDRAKAVEYLNRIKEASNELLVLVNDIMEMSRLESGEEAPCDLTEVLRELESAVQAETRARELELSIRGENLVHSKVICDRKQLIQALRNLLNNAVRATPPRGQAGVLLTELQGGSQDYGFYRFVIQDSGAGMKQELAEHIFDPVEGGQSSLPGEAQDTGMEMTITRNIIVNLMHGTIRARSEEGRGTEVTVSLQFRLAGEPVQN